MCKLIKCCRWCQQAKKGIVRPIGLTTALSLTYYLYRVGSNAVHLSEKKKNTLNINKKRLVPSQGIYLLTCGNKQHCYHAVSWSKLSPWVTWNELV